MSAFEGKAGAPGNSLDPDSQSLSMIVELITDNLNGRSMADEIFLIQGESLQELKAEAYNSEDLLQQLLEVHPNLIAGGQIDSDNPRRWLLITREMGVPGEEGGGNRWSVDHLFLDQEGIPTLVEVKRASDTRIRREVVGQMLDYAANAIAYWPLEEIRGRFLARCEAEGIDPDEELGTLLEDSADVEWFWPAVKTNLQAGKVRLLFVADKIPAELRLIVEFLNSQMDPAEVLALEIKQYVGEGLRTLVPRVLGQSAEAKNKRAGGRAPRQWDEESFFAELSSQEGDEIASVAQVVLDWANDQGLTIKWGIGQATGSFGALEGKSGVRLLYAWTNGRITVPLAYMKSKPPFSKLNLLQEFCERINQVPGVSLGEGQFNKRWNDLDLKLLLDPQARDAYFKALEWAIEMIQAESVT
jgi:hypothetical protein